MSATESLTKRVVITDGTREYLSYECPQDFDAWWRPVSEGTRRRVEILDGQHGPVVASTHVAWSLGVLWLTTANAPSRSAESSAGKASSSTGGAP